MHLDDSSKFLQAQFCSLLSGFREKERKKVHAYVRMCVQACVTILVVSIPGLLMH